MKRGFQRLKIDGTFYEIADAPALDKKLKHDIDVVVDRIVVRADMASRLRPNSFETAAGALPTALRFIEFADAPVEGEEPRRVMFSSKFACPVSGFTIPEIEPRLFSFNNPFGACPTCGGLGSQMKVDADLVVPDSRLTLRKGAIAPWAKSSSPYYAQTLDALARHYKFRLDTPWAELPAKARDAILNGSGNEEIRMAYEDGLRSYEVKKPFEGVVTNLERRYRETESEWSREEILRYMSATPCAACEGFRLKPEALAVKIDGQHIGEVSLLSVKTAVDWARALPGKLDSKRNEIAQRTSLKEIGDLADLPARRRPGLSDARRALRRRFRVAKASASVSRRRSARASPACSMCSTSLRSACISATMRACSIHCAGCAASAIASSSSNMTKTPFSPPIMSSTSAPAPASMAANSSSPRARRPKSSPIPIR